MSPEPSHINPATIAREIAKEYADHTDEKLELYFKGNTDAMSQLTKSMSTLAASVQNGNEQLARYEERQTASTERMERIERTVRDLGVHQRESDRRIQLKIEDMQKDVDDNSKLRKGMLWLVSIILAAIITTGVAVFHPINNPGTEQ